MLGKARHAPVGMGVQQLLSTVCRRNGYLLESRAVLLCMLCSSCSPSTNFRATINQSINQSIYVLGGNWDPTDKKFSSVNSYRQDLLPTCKTFPKETTTCIWFTQNHKVCNSTTVLQELQMRWLNLRKDAHRCSMLSPKVRPVFGMRLAPKTRWQTGLWTLAGQGPIAMSIS